MNQTSEGRTQPCGLEQSRTRLDQANAFLAVAELVGTEKDELATPGVAAALAVLAGIAASDAACCADLGRRARGQDHKQALAVVAKIKFDGPKMASDLKRLLEIKDDAHYGMLLVSSQRASGALRQARHLVDIAAAHVNKS